MKCEFDTDQCECECGHIRYEHEGNHDFRTGGCMVPGCVCILFDHKDEE